VLVAVIHPATATPGTEVAVASDGSTAYTPFATVDGRLYQVTVTGTYAFNTDGRLADCGHWNAPEAEGAWFQVGNLLVDGAVAACADQEYMQAHTYVWQQQGTGAPFAFRIVDDVYADNTGSLTVDVLELPGVDQAPYDVDGSCEVFVVDDSQQDLRVFPVVVHAEATGGSGEPPELSAVCEFRAGTAVAATVRTAVSGPAAAGAGAPVLPRRAYVVCLSITVVEDGVTSRIDEPCRAV
jgi:hypothetical protein